MNVIPAFRAPLTRETSVDRAKVAELRALPYAEYLVTPHWRRRRNLALNRAGWKCGRCSSNVALQVHHLTYERVGEERDADLEVLCRSCHEGLHFDESRQANVGVYLKLASDCVKAGDRTYSDLTEALYLACKKHGIPARPQQIDRAVEAVLTNRWIAPIATFDEIVAAPAGPVSDADVMSILEALGLDVPIRSMPSVRGRIDIYGPLPYDEVEHDRY